VHQVQQVVGLRAVDQLQVGQAGFQQPTHTLDIARIDRGREPADAAVGAEPVAHPQLGDRLVQGPSLRVGQVPIPDGAGEPVHPVARGRGVVALVGAAAQVPSTEPASTEAS
jgi:hypothetical protein